MTSDTPRPPLLLPLLATALGLGLCLDQARLGYLAREAEVSRLLVAPPVWLWSALAVAMLSAGGVGLYGARVRHDARLARVPLLALVIVAFVELFVTASARLRVTASFGVASLSEIAESATPTDLVALADARLYAAKNAGRNRVCSEG